MASCERCWWKAHGREGFYHDPNAAYYAEMDEAQRTHAVCTLPTIEGAKARAGVYWDEATQSDRRIYVAGLRPQHIPPTPSPEDRK